MERKDFLDLLKNELSEVEKELTNPWLGIEDEFALSGRWYELDRLMKILEGSN